MWRGYEVNGKYKKQKIKVITKKIHNKKQWTNKQSNKIQWTNKHIHRLIHKLNPDFETQISVVWLVGSDLMNSG